MPAFLRYAPANVFSGFMLAILLCSTQFAVASSENQNAFNLTEIASGVYVHTGQHAGFEDENSDDIANTGFIVGDDCVAVIDTGGSVQTATAFLSAIKKTTDKKICYVINTHVHFDHLLGNIVFKRPGVKFVGHKNLADEVAANRLFFLQQYRDNLGDAPDENTIVAPEILVEDSTKLDLGNRVITLTAHAVAHSHSDLSIYDERSGTLWLSDLLFMQRIPALDGSLKGWLKIMHELSTTEAKRVVPGHGPASASPADAFKPQTDYLQTLLSQTREKISQGLFMEDIVSSVGEKEKLKWLLHEQHHKRNVTRAFSELEWE